MPTRSNGDTTVDLCPSCGVGRVEVVQRNAEHFDGSVTVTFTDELSKCDSCGEEFYTYEQSQAHSRALAAALREAHGVVAPEKIRAIRMGLRMTIAQFERAMGVGPKTVGRWERGTVTPSSAARGMLWIAEHHPDAFLDYASKRAGFALPATEGVAGHIGTARSGDTRATVLRYDGDNVIALTTRGRTKRSDTNEIPLVDAPDKERAV